MRALGAILVLGLVLSGPQARAQEGSTAALEGQVTWKGTLFPRREVLWPPGSRGHDVVLERMLVDRRIVDESLVVDPKTRGIRDVLLLLPDFRRQAAGAEEVEVRLEGLACQPKLVILGKKSKLVAVNRDPLPHLLVILGDDGFEKEVEVVPGARVAIDLPKGKVFDLISDRFDFMSARVHRVADQPAIVTGDDGRFAIRGLKAQEVLLYFEHPLLGWGSKTLAVAPGVTTSVELHESDFQSPSDDSWGSPFTGADEPQFRIEGLIVPRWDFEAVVDYLGARHHKFGLPRRILETYALRQVLVPLAASYAHHREELPRLRARGVAFEAALAGGISFSEAAKKIDEAAVASRFGPSGRQDIAPWVGLRIFSSPRKVLIGPVWSRRGLHYFQVDSVSGEGSEERRSGQQAFFPWREGLSDHERRAFEQALSERARVEALDPRREALMGLREGR